MMVFYRDKRLSMVKNYLYFMFYNILHSSCQIPAGRENAVSACLNLQGFDASSRTISAIFRQFSQNTGKRLCEAGAFCYFRRLEMRGIT